MSSRKVVHTEPIEHFNDKCILEAKERGHSWVRRNLLMWPYNHELMHRVTSDNGKDYLEFFFVPTDEPVQAPSSHCDDVNIWDLPDPWGA